MGDLTDLLSMTAFLLGVPLVAPIVFGLIAVFQEK